MCSGFIAFNVISSSELTQGEMGANKFDDNDDDDEHHHHHHHLIGESKTHCC